MLARTARVLVALRASLQLPRRHRTSEHSLGRSIPGHSPARPKDAFQFDQRHSPIYGTAKQRFAVAHIVDFLSAIRLELPRIFQALNLHFVINFCTILGRIFHSVDWKFPWQYFWTARLRSCQAWTRVKGGGVTVAVTVGVVLCVIKIHRGMLEDKSMEFEIGTCLLCHGTTQKEPPTKQQAEACGIPLAAHGFARLAGICRDVILSRLVLCYYCTWMEFCEPDWWVHSAGSVGFIFWPPFRV